MHPLLLLSFLASALSVPLSEELTPSWVNICNGTYLFSEDTKSWNDAYGECELYGSHIAQGFPADKYWHSANDIMSEGVWRQYDEELLSWSPWWFDEEPLGGKERNCGRVALKEDRYAGQWGSSA